MDAREILERRIDELCMENGRLRGQVARLTSRSIRTADKMYCLETENAKLRGARDVWQENDAKLRELVSVLAHCAADSGCDSCPINGGCARVGELDLCETVHDRMRELGVEAE